LERLGGLPLALATAGAFLQRRPWSFERYLEEYEAKWNIDPRRPIKLQEYHERTLWTTWNISYDRLEMDDLEAAKMLRLLAYFGNQSLWYEYFCAGLTDNSPLHEVIGDETSFHGVMEVLSEYSFLEFHPNLRTWSMHTCVHDWTLATLNKNINTQCYWYALECAARSIRKIFRDDRGPYIADSFESLAFACLVPHAVRLCQQRFIQADVFANSIFAQLEFVLDISGLLHDQTQSPAGSMLLLSVLPHTQRILGPNHRFTLDIMSSIGWSYHQQLKFDKARQFLLRAVAKQEETLGLYNLSTISTIANLGAVYISQGNLDDATQILCRTIAVTRTTDSEWSAEEWACQSKLLEIHTNLATAFMQQNKDRDAERILKDVISQREKIQGQTHLSTLSVLSNLGVVYQKQGKSEDAERISRLVLASTDKFLSPAHQVTLACVTNLGETFLGQKRFKEAEHMFRRALAGYEDTLGPHHEKTLDIARRLGDLYSDKGDFHDAEQMYKRVLTWKEQALGLEHQSTIEILDNLACLYFRKGQMDDAEQMFVRALRGSELRGNERIGRQRSVSDIAFELGAIYLQNSQLDKAEKMYMKALGGFQKEIDPNDSKIPAVAASLWIVYQIQGDWTKAERMRALAGSVINSLLDQAYL
jgi:tetratricopeptide (TPR) repeat protein